MAKYKHDSDTMMKMFREKWSEKDLKQAVENMMFSSQIVVFDNILDLAGYIYYNSAKHLNLVELENKIMDLTKEYEKYAIMLKNTQLCHQNCLSIM